MGFRLDIIVDNSKRPKNVFLTPESSLQGGAYRIAITARGTRQAAICSRR